MKLVNLTYSSLFNLSDSLIINNKEEELVLCDSFNTFNRSFNIIYIYTLKDKPEHGYKVGMTTCNPNENFKLRIEKRIKEQEHELALSDEELELYGSNRELLYWTIGLTKDGKDITDHQIHDYLKTEFNLIIEKKQEWFSPLKDNISLDDIKEAIQTYKNKVTDRTIYTCRKEQRECVDKLISYFESKDKSLNPRFLLNCKMRFGKCFTTYKYCEEANLHRILILTFIPAVEDSWKEDLNHITKKYKYITDANLDELDDELFLGEDFVVFLSLQNLLGKDSTGKSYKSKFKSLKAINFDLIVLDEYHFGAWNDHTQGALEKEFKDLEDTLKNFKSKSSKTNSKSNSFETSPDNVIEKLELKTQRTICLSGTPFRALEKEEFSDINTFTYSYFDEQKNKYPNIEKNDKSIINNDYEYFPDMEIYGYTLTDFIYSQDIKSCIDDKEKWVSLNNFFQTSTEDIYDKECYFEHEEIVKEFLEMIKGNKEVPINHNGELHLPYINEEMRDSNRHTLWLLPRCVSCNAMESLLRKDPFFNENYEILNLVKPEFDGKKALKELNRSIKGASNVNKKGTICLTVNRLTTGVTVKEWSAVLVLKDLQSPESYFQSIFRIQTPYVKEGKILKKIGYVYDFNIERASKLVFDYIQKTNDLSTLSVKEDYKDFLLNIIPIYKNGFSEERLTGDILNLLAQFGLDNNKPLSQKISNISKLVLENPLGINEALNDPDVADVIEDIYSHKSFKQQTSTKVKNIKTPLKDLEEQKKNPHYKLGFDDAKNFVKESIDEIVRDLKEETTNEYDKTTSVYLEAIIRELERSQVENLDIDAYQNGFKRAYDQEIKKYARLQEDIRLIAEDYIQLIKKREGTDFKVTKVNKQDFLNEMKIFLNDEKNIPLLFRKVIFNRIFREDFKKIVLNEFVADEERVDVQIQNKAINKIAHILSRLLQFLYISVYRERKFDEVFDQAKDEVFLQAIGISKDKFAKLNKYNIFNEELLNRYIDEFFRNESLQVKLRNEDEHNYYRNSFNWFGFGLEKDK